MIQASLFSELEKDIEPLDNPLSKKYPSRYTHPDTGAVLKSSKYIKNGKKKVNWFLNIIIIGKRNLMRIGRMGNLMDYKLNGMKMDRRKMKELSRMGNQLDYLLLGMRMDRKKKK